MSGKLRMAVAAVLLMAAGNAWALGLGKIEVKSRRNQPLLAEIPIVSTTPGELEMLQARLASPETFRRVGLSPPTGAAANLQFSLGSDTRGRPVIRVTTVAPVDQAVLNFLIEVDWGQGRLVREYSALVEAPNTASAPVQPAIEAPAVAAPNVVQRPREPEPVAEVAVPSPSPAPVSPPPPVAAAPEPLPPPVAVAPTPPPAASPASAPAPQMQVPAPSPSPSPTQYGPVKAGETLSGIVGKLDLASGFSLDQALLALLRANPDAFLGDDVNRLKRGAVLRVPGSSDVASIGADEAKLVVGEQMRQWRQSRRAVLQPQAPPVTAATTTATPVAAATTSSPKAAAAAPEPVRSAAPQRTQQARLQIVPPSASGTATDTRSGTTAGGEGKMLQQQLQQKNEDIAAKAAEIGELKERVAELEKLRAQQQQLLSMKDSELASAQQRLAEARTQPEAAAAVQAPPTQSATTTPWLWGGLAVLGMALLAWLFARRKPKQEAPDAKPRRGFDSETLAASLVVPTTASPAAPTDAATEMPAAADVPAASPAKDVRVADTPAPGAGSAPSEAPPAVTVVDVKDVPASVSAPRSDAPNWHSGWTKTDAPPPATGSKPRFVPEEPAAATPPPAAKASVEQRMKLARAFLDIGDDNSARELLRELLDDVDPAARNEAARILRELG